MKRVLVVEDREENAYYLRALLEGNGWAVDVARHGAEALVMARHTPVDVVVSDLLMPVMDGYTLLRHWKADPRLARVPFVVYTATYTDVEDERLALRLGADAFILKPSDPEDFLTKLRAVETAVAAVPAPPMAAPSAPAADENALLRLYSETLIRKLEGKMLELEESNRALLQEQAELSLRDRAIQAASQGIVITDPQRPDNPIVYASPGFERLTGYAAAEVIGRNCRLLQGPDTDAEAIGRLRAAVAEARACTVEILNYRKDGTPFWNDLTVSPVHGAAGELTHFVGVQTDVTARRALETQFRQAQKMEAVGQLAAGVAHDFNNLLSVILSYASLVLEELRPADPLRDDVSEIQRAGERATELTRQLLAFSRQQVLTPRILEPSRLVLAMEKMLRRLLGGGIDLAIVTPRTFGRIHADAGQVEQVVMNLAVNARDAMPSGGKLTIETSNLDLVAGGAAGRSGAAPGPYVLLTVSDTGVGMDAATRERIFEPFFTTKEKGRGTGLGLSTVFGIVNQSQGHIEVESEPGRGTTFRIYFPRVEHDVVPPSAPPPPPSTLRGSETVLVVEDEEQVRLLARAILRRHGYEVLDAQNAGEAFLICEQYVGKIHLLLTDVVMARMSGTQLAERLARTRPEMKVLFMSGLADAAVPFVAKPITPDVLLRKVREVLEGR